MLLLLKIPLPEQSSAYVLEVRLAATGAKQAGSAGRQALFGSSTPVVTSVYSCKMANLQDHMRQLMDNKAFADVELVACCPQEGSQESIHCMGVWGKGRPRPPQFDK